jgi:hypothetical protein
MKKLSIALAVTARLGWGGAQAADNLQEEMTGAKLQADLGNHEAAAEVFGRLAGDPATPRPLRAEALVRRGTARWSMGNTRAAVDDFARAMKEHGDDEAAVRLLVHAVGGIVPGGDRWRRLWPQLQLGIDRTDPANPSPRILWPDANWQGQKLLDDGKAKVVRFERAGARPYTGMPINLHFQDGDFGDILRLFADISGLNVVVDPGTRGEATTFRVQGVPWDDVLDRFLQALGLSYQLNENVLRIGRYEDVWRRPLARYTGKTIDLDFHEVDLEEALRTIAAHGGVRVDASAGISGHVTFKLNEVHWDQALDLVATLNGLEWTRQGKVISVRPESPAASR